MRNHATLPKPSSAHLQTAQMNLERSARALDAQGEKGLQAELDRIYPSTGMESVEVAPGIHGIKMPKALPVRPFSARPKPKA